MRLARRLARPVALAIALALSACTTVQPPGDPGPPTQTVRADDALGVAAAIVASILSFFSVVVVAR